MCNAISHKENFVLSVLTMKICEKLKKKLDSEFPNNVLVYTVHKDVHGNYSCASTIFDLLCNPSPKHPAALHPE
jgi:hypothetical protein